MLQTGRCEHPKAASSFAASDGSAIEVKWGGEWVRPAEFSINGRVAVAFVETRTGVWRHVHFTNRVFGDKSWRYLPNDEVRDPATR